MTPQPPCNFRAFKYGMFVHYGVKLTRNPDGSIPATGDQTADGFDAKSLAEDLKRFGVEYVIFTVWHANTHLLYPSAASDRWFPGHSVQRDLIGEMIQAVKAQGIAVLLYTHPRDGHDFSEQDAIATGWGAAGKPFTPNPNPATFDRKRWNDFINDIYAEMLDRYGAEIVGLFIDEGSAKGDSESVVDYPRLRKTIKSRNPELVMIHNYYGNLYSCDMGEKEYWNWGEFASADGRTWPSHTMPVATVITKNWWAEAPLGTPVVRFSVEDLYRYTVLQAGTCIDGGGVQFAAGPYVGGGWETGVAETMTALARLIEPVACSIKGTFASHSFPTGSGTTVNNMTWGVATRSQDGKREYIHVLKAPQGSTLSLPCPTSWAEFVHATIVPTGRQVCLIQNTTGVHLTLPPGETWNPLDTVIELTLK